MTNSSHPTEGFQGPTALGGIRDGALATAPENAQLDTFWMYVSVFGTLWGGIELTLGTFLHVLHVPKTGLVMGVVTLILILAQRYLYPVRGATLCTGIVAACIKCLSPGGIIVGPVVGILSEALIVELCLIVAPRSRISAIVAATLALTWSQAQSLFKTWLYYGGDFVEGLVKLVTKFFSVPWSATVGWILVGALLALLALLGTVIGLLGHGLGRRVERALAEERRARDTGDHGSAPDAEVVVQREVPAMDGSEHGGAEAETADAMQVMAAVSGRRASRQPDEQTIRTRLILLPIAIATIAAQFPGNPLWAAIALAVWLATLAIGARGVLRAIWWPRFWIVSVVVCLLAGLVLAWSPGGWNWSLGIEATARMFIRGIHIFSFITWATRCIRSEECLAFWKRLGLPGLGRSLTRAYALLPDWLDEMNAMLRDRPGGLRANLRYAHDCARKSLVRAVLQAEKLQ